MCLLGQLHGFRQASLLLDRKGKSEQRDRKQVRVRGRLPQQHKPRSAERLPCGRFAQHGRGHGQIAEESATQAIRNRLDLSKLQYASSQ